MLDTAFIGKNLIYLEETSSTNDFLVQLLSQNPFLVQGTVVLAGYQTGGRGQQGSCWQSNSNENLLLSVLFKPKFLLAHEQFALSQAIALGILDFLRSDFGLSRPIFGIKWPNDLYVLGVERKKIGGILIENVLQGMFVQQSVVGIGLNINQTVFDLSLPNATSLRSIFGIDFDVRLLCGMLLLCLERRYLQLQSGDFGQIRSDYLADLLGYGQFQMFLIEGKRCRGRIVGVDELGFLMVSIDGIVLKFTNKALSFIF